jgi:hypothetical protein
MMKLFHRFFWGFLLGMAGFGGSAVAQEEPEVFYPPGMELPEDAASGARIAATPAVDTPAAEGAVELPRSYRNIRLGMSLEDLKAALQRDGMFNFRGDRDVSFLPSSARSRNVVETTGPSFIKRAFFQLWEGELFIMGFSLHTGLVDHYSVFTSLVDKYGPPSYLDPKQAVWETNDTRIAIEWPLTVKYIDMRIFNNIIGESALVETGEINRRQEFLDEF